MELKDTHMQMCASLVTGDLGKFRYLTLSISLIEGVLEQEASLVADDGDPDDGVRVVRDELQRVAA
jgi:hypothetical protein